MPPAVGALAAIGGGSALAGGAALAATGAGLYGAKRDRDAASAANAQSAEAREESLAYLKEAAEQARNDIFELYPSAQESRQAGIGAGMDFLKQATPVQIGAFQEGNMGAQRMMAAGLPQMQNAILGNQVDYSAIQPQQIDTSGISRLLESAQVPQVAQMNPTVNENIFRSPETVEAAEAGIGQDANDWSQYNWSDWGY